MSVRKAKATVSDWLLTATTDGQGATLHLSGDMDVATAADVVALARQVHRPGAVLTVDLRHLSFVDSYGVHALLRVKWMVELHGGQLALTNPPAELVRLLELTALVGDFHLEHQGPGALSPLAASASGAMTSD